LFASNQPKPYVFKAVGGLGDAWTRSPRGFPASTSGVSGSWTIVLKGRFGRSPVQEFGLMESVYYCIMPDLLGPIEAGRAMRRDGPVGRLRRRRTKLYEEWVPRTVNSAG